MSAVDKLQIAVVLWAIPSILMYGDAIACLRKEFKQVFCWQDRVVSAIAGAIWPVTLFFALRDRSLLKDGWRLW